MSIVNTPTIITKVVDLGAAYTVTSPNIIISNPDGTSYSAIATVSPSGSANPHTFSAMFVPPMGGLSQGRFQGVVGGQTLNFPFKLWATWTDIYFDVRNMLGVNAKTLPDSRMDMEIHAIVTELTVFASLPKYYLYTPAYKIGFDQGLTKLVASRLRPWVGGKRPTGEVSLMKKGNTTVQYSIGSPKMEFSLETQWWEQGMELLSSNIPEIASAMLDNRTGDEIMSRGDLAPGNYFPLAGWQVGRRGENISNPFSREWQGRDEF